MTKVLKEKLTIEDFIGIARGNFKIGLSDGAKKKVVVGRERLDERASKETIYGVNTGFGALAEKSIPQSKINQLQKNLIRSHACGVGEPLEKEVVKGMMLLLVNSLAKGYSGIRLETLETLVEMFNKEVLPVIPEKGSLGASGDLVPLAHLALVLIGQGEAIYKGKPLKGKEALREAGIKPVKLKAKEGLALINGTHLAAALAAIALWDSINLAKTADIAGAISLEALQCSKSSFDPRIQALKSYPGQIEVAQNLKKLTLGSPLLCKKQCPKVQDPYSLRCIPQVHGASRQSIKHVQELVEIELNSVTDNPLIFEKDILSGGNFHAQMIALATDYLGIAVAELAEISERRAEQLLNSHLSGLPPFLAQDEGLNSGLMIAQYTAAALVSENKALAHPASVDSIPVSAGQEDHVSMGTTAARRTRQVLGASEKVLGVELLCGAQALDFRRKKPGRGTLKAYKTIRKYISFLKKDREIYKDINKIYNLIHRGIIIKVVEEEVGKLK